MLKIDLIRIHDTSEMLAFELVPSRASIIVLVRDDGNRMGDNDYWYRVARTLRRDLVRSLNLKRRLILIEEVLLPKAPSGWVNHFIVGQDREPVLHLPLVMLRSDPLVMGIVQLRERRKPYRAMRTWLVKTLNGEISPWVS